MSTRAPRPGFKPGVKSGSKPDLHKTSTIWINKPTPPLKSAYQVGQEIPQNRSFGKSYRCRRKKDRRI